MKGTWPFASTVAFIAFAAAPRAPAAPPNDHFAGALVLEGASGTTSGTNEGATREAGEPMIDFYEGGRSVWWRWTAPATADVTFHTFGSNFDTILGVYTGTAVNSLQLVAENDDSEHAEIGLHSLVMFSVVAGTVYHVAVDGVDFEDEHGPDAESGTIVLSWLSGAPANDDFDAGVVLEGASGRVTGVSVGATIEPGEPMIDGVPGGRSVWWRWTAPRTERMTVLTFGSDFDTLLGVYTGTAVNALTLVAQNDDAEVGAAVQRPAPCDRPGCNRPPPQDTSSQSQVHFDATAGTLYHFVVDGFEGESGNVLLTWLAAPDGAPENDPFATRIRLEGPEGLALGSSAGASREPGEPDHVQADGNASIWWSWVAPDDGRAEFDTSGSAFDTLLAVYTGTAVNGLSLVVENDDDERVDDVTSFVQFRASAGIEYQIAVDGYEGESGFVALGWRFTLQPEAPAFIRGDCDGNGFTNISDAVCTLEWLFRGGEEPGCPAATNADGIGGVDLTDPIYLLLHLFGGGPGPVAPFPECGLGTLEADEQIGCWSSPACQ